MPDPPRSSNGIGLSEVVFLEINPCPTPSGLSSFGRTISFAVNRDDTDGIYAAEEGDHSDAFAIGAMLSSVSAR